MFAIVVVVAAAGKHYGLAEEVVSGVHSLSTNDSCTVTGGLLLANVSFICQGNYMANDRRFLHSSSTRHTFSLNFEPE